MRYYIEIYDFQGKKIVDASVVELDVVLKILDVYRAVPKIVINGICKMEDGKDERWTG